MPNLASGIWQGETMAVVIVVQNHVAPTQAEWDGYIADIEKVVSIESSVALAFTDGGGPDSKQRARVNAIVDRRKARSAVVTTSTFIRGVVTALEWFNPETHAFHPDEIVRATRFLGLDEAQVEALWPTVMSLDQSLSQRSQVVIAATAALGGRVARTG